MLDAQEQQLFLPRETAGLTAHLIRLREGQMPAERTPLYKAVPANKVISGWFDILKEHNSIPELTEYEISRQSKFGPQGGVPPLEERMDILSRYYNGVNPINISDESILTRAIELVRKDLFGTSHSIRMLTEDQVLARGTQEDKYDTNSGLRDWDKRKKKEVQDHAKRDVRNGMWKLIPTTAGSRSSRLNHRFIFMYPFSANIAGQQILYPLMDIIRRNQVDSFAAWEGFEAVEKAFTNMKYDEADLILSTDYVKMDTHITEPQGKIVLRVILPILDGNAKKRVEDVFHYAFHRRTLVKIWKVVEEVMNSLLSGFDWTNTLESILSLVLHYYFLIKCGLRNCWLGSAVLGDDGTIAFRKANRTPEEIIKLLTEVAKEFGLVMHPEKQRVSSDTWVYLQRFFKKDWLIDGNLAGAYPGGLALNTAMHPERYHNDRRWSEEMEIMRWLMILENANHHPLFHNLIEYLAKGDKYDLGRKHPTFLRNLEKNYEIARSIAGMTSTYTEAHLTRGILDFDVVRYLLRQ
jgi:hypothetical protein